MTTIDQQSLNEELASISGSGTVQEVHNLINLGATDINRALFIASIRGNLPVAKYLVNQGASDLNRSLGIASAYGNIDVIKYLVEQGANDLKSAIIDNIQSVWYNPEIIKYLLERGVDDLNDIFTHAAASGRDDLIDYLISIDFYPDNIYESLELSALNGNTATFKHLMSIYGDQIQPHLLTKIIDILKRNMKERDSPAQDHKNIINVINSYLNNDKLSQNYDKLSQNYDENDADDIYDKLYDSSYKGNFGDVYRLTRNKSLSYNVIDKAIDQVNRGFNEMINNDKKYAEYIYLPIRDYLVELGMEV